MRSRGCAVQNKGITLNKDWFIIAEEYVESSKIFAERALYVARKQFRTQV